MSHIPGLDVSGFKGIEEISIKTSKINIITGRNNSGKTSLLEAIEVANNPTKIKKFEEELRHIINKKHERAEINIHSNRSLEIRDATESEYFEYVDDAIHEIVDPFFDLYSERLKGTQTTLEGEFLNKTKKREDLVEEIIEENLNKSNIHEEFQPHFTTVKINEEIFPYVRAEKSRSPKIKDFLRGIIEDEKIKNYYGIEDKHPFRYRRVNLMEPLKEGLFVKKPSKIAKAQKIDRAKVDRDSVDPEKDEDAIKIADISEYLKEHDIVPSLKTFSFDSLVLEGENGKYNVYYNFMGDGLKAIVGFLWRLQGDNDIVLIEEPENHLHPGYIKELVRFLIQFSGKHDVQLFITTHSTDFIQEFFSDNLQEAEINYLQNEFKVINMDPNLPETYNTRKHLKNLRNYILICVEYETHNILRRKI